MTEDKNKKTLHFVYSFLRRHFLLPQCRTIVYHFGTEKETRVLNDVTERYQIKSRRDEESELPQYFIQ